MPVKVAHRYQYTHSEWNISFRLSINKVSSFHISTIVALRETDPTRFLVTQNSQMLPRPFYSNIAVDSSTYTGVTESVHSFLRWWVTKKAMGVHVQGGKKTSGERGWVYSSV